MFSRATNPSNPAAGSQMWRLFYTLYRQTGADMKLVPGQKAEVDEDAAVKTLKFIRSLLNDKIASRSGDGGTATAEFLHGESGMFFGGVWELPALKDAKLPVDAMPIPALFGTQAAYADSHTFVLPRQSKVDPERRKHVYRMVAEILKRSVKWADGGHVPAYQPVTKSAEYLALKPQSNYAGIPAYVNYDPDVWFSGAGSDFQNYFSENVQNVFLGSADPSPRYPYDRPCLPVTCCSLVATSVNSSGLFIVRSASVTPAFRACSVL